MLYLEDYLEMIEHLPQELRDRFTEMRELDLSVQNNMDDLEKRVKVLFNEWKRNPNDLPPTADLEFEGIKKEYYKTLEDQDEKVVLANQMYELVDRYLRRLDTELHKFKCELEADNKGITELLEKRSLELDTPIASTTSSQKENRYERYTSSRPREKRRSDNCHTSGGGVTYPEKRPHLGHSLSVSDQRLSVSVGATNGNNTILLASQLQGGGGSGHTLHGLAQSTPQHPTNNSTNITSNSPHYSSINTNPSNSLINSNLTYQQNSIMNTSSLNASHNLNSINSTLSATSQYHSQSATSNNNNTSANANVLMSTANASNSGPIAAAAASSVGGLSAASTISTNSSANYTLGAGPAIAAAASQAIAATQKMQQGRRTPSLKASYEAINSTGGSGSGGLVKVSDMAIGRELAGAAQTAIQAIQQDSNKKRNTKKYSSHSTSHNSASLRHQMGGGGASSSSSSNMGGVSNQQQSMSTSSSSQLDLVSDVDGYLERGGGGGSVEEMGGVNGEDLGSGDYIDSYDPNEPRYCLCNQVSYGDMVACDNEDCPSEWFHYPCVGITAPPKGKWYCPQCTSSMRRRGGRKN